MDNITIRECGQYDEVQILPLYKSVGWHAYCVPKAMEQGFAASLCTLGAYDQNELVGLLRLVGDGITVVLIQDILVRPEYQRRGVGRRLIASLLSRYAHVRQIYVLTDDLTETVGFYKAVGFTPVETAHYRAFTRLRP